MNTKPILALGLAALSLTAFAAGPESFQGKRFPAFHMTDTSGKSWTNASLKGKVVLIDFWATWCGPCRMATPMLEKLHQKYGSRGLVVIGADTFEHGAADQRGGAINYAKQNNLTYHFTLQNDKLSEALGMDAIPTMFVVDKNGVVQKVNVGFDPSEAPQLDALVAKLLKG